MYTVLQLANMPKYLTALVLLFVFALSAFLTVSLLSGKNPFSKDYSDVVKMLPSETPPITPLFKNSSYNFLFLGYGGAGHDGGNLSDVVMLANLNPEKRQITIISIPRDLWVDVPVRSDIKEGHKINAAYAIGSDDKKFGMKEPQYRGEHGGGTMAKKVISEVTGLSINNYAGVDFESFKKIIDILGGVEVDVPVTFNDYFYPIKSLENETCGFSSVKIAEVHAKYSGFELEKQFKCRYEHLHFDKGINKMDGESALKFVRSRHSMEDGGDFARSRRQQRLILAVKEKLLSSSFFNNSEKLYSEFGNLIKTDLDLANFKNFYTLINPPDDYKIKFISLSTENVLLSSKSLNGQYILIPKNGEGVWTGIHSYINQELSTK